MFLVLCRVRCSQPEATYCGQPTVDPSWLEDVAKTFPLSLLGLPISHSARPRFSPRHSGHNRNERKQFSGSIPGEHLVT